MGYELLHQIPHWIHCCTATDWHNSTFLTFSRSTGPSRKFIMKSQPGCLSFAQTSKAVARKRMGYFIVSSQEEQIASALHDHSRAWPERGLCLPKGDLEWHGLVAQSGMWSSVTGTRMVRLATLFTAGPLPPSFQPLPSHAALGTMMSSSAPGSGKLSSLKIQSKVWDLKKASNIPQWKMVRKVAKSINRKFKCALRKHYFNWYTVLLLVFP